MAENESEQFFSTFERKRKLDVDESKVSEEILEESSNDIGEELEDIELLTAGFYKPCNKESFPVSGNATHEVFYLDSEDKPPILKEIDQAPAKEYPFELDDFQKESIKCVQNEQSVLVAAHTSAGKTVVAQYAIAQSLRNQQRVIYTSPIKALSNQKYRELSEEFTDVGLQTGDVTINPNASCLVMTTEILRQMLYKGSELMREVGWVIFDEIHYMRDAERGVVWEETIILLPDNVRYVFLSATIPNAGQFAQWIATIHSQPVHVISTDFRPTPLQQYIFPSEGDGLYLIVDELGNFRNDNYEKAMSKLSKEKDKKRDPGYGNNKAVDNKIISNSNVARLVKLGMSNNFAPMIIFSFSKKECEFYALHISKMDFNTEIEKNSVQQVFENAIDCLKDEDKTLTQIKNILPLLKKGIGIHHSGLLPILKEVTEILFSEGLIKVLFATETFAMGLNMPARTVIFTTAMKYDGKSNRLISGGEYIQMSGRAGRRGIDDKGIVILILNEKISHKQGKDLLKGTPDNLNSAFRLTYTMLLNLLRLEGINPEYMVERSFYQFQMRSKIPLQLSRIRKLETKYRSFKINKSLDDSTQNEFSTNEENEKFKTEDFEKFLKLKRKIDQFEKQISSFICKPQYILHFLKPGRLVKIQYNNLAYPWGVVINHQKAKNNGEDCNVILLLVNVVANTVKNNSYAFPLPAKSNSKHEDHEMVVIPVNLNLVKFVSVVVILLPDDITPKKSRLTLLETLKEIENKFQGEIPLLDPIKDMKIKDETFGKTFKKYLHLNDKFSLHPLKNKYDSMIKDSDNHDDSSVLDILEEKIDLANQIKVAKEELKMTKQIVQLAELKSRKRVLRRLGFITQSDVVELKGRVACEITCADELLITEMIFNGAFNELNCHQIAALLSCFVFQEKSNTAKFSKLEEELKTPLKLLMENAKKISTISSEAKFNLDYKQYVETFAPDLMDVVYSWTRGASFKQIIKMTTVFEGTIIRTMRRLEELLRQMCCAGKAIGNKQLEDTFLEAVLHLKRDIIFAASLYL